MRKTHSKELKFKVAMAALKGDKTVNEICKEFNIAPSLVHKWKTHLKQQGPCVFAENINLTPDKYLQNKIEQLHAQIGKLTVENDFLKKNLEN
jgi:transposase-like protein